MKTTHQLAKELLAQPDVRVVLPTAGDPGQPPMDDPVLTFGGGYDDPNGGEFAHFVELRPACLPPVFADPAARSLAEC